MKSKGKHRVFVALYYRDGIAQDDHLRRRLGSAAYHWAIWVEPKGSQGQGCYYEVQSQEASVDEPEMWKYNHSLEANYLRSGSMVGRIMIGKLPDNIAFADVDGLLSLLPIPDHRSPEYQNCVNWIVRALEAMRIHGWIEDFDIERFIHFATERANYWFDSGKWVTERPVKENYTKRKFP